MLKSMCVTLQFMRAGKRSIAVGLLLLGGFVPIVEAATLYTSQQLAPNRNLVEINNDTRLLTMRQDSPALAHLHIVIENWNLNFYSEFRPGTLPGTTRSIGKAFNDTQQITGYAETADANGSIYAADGYTVLNPRRAFLFNGAFVDLSAYPPLNSANVESFGTAINNQEDVVGYWIDTAGKHAFLYSHGAVIDLGALSGANSPADTQANAVNNLGQVAGTSRLAPGTGPGANAWPHAFMYDHGTMTDLGMLPGWEWSVGTAINDAGEIVGTVHAGNHAVGCFIYTGGVMRDMGVLGNGGAFPYCQVYAINNAGIAVGYANAIPTPPDFQTTGPFVYSNGQMTNLNTLISPTDDLVRNHVVLKNATSINDRGQILATTGTPASGGTYYILTPILDPSPAPTPAPTPTPTPSSTAPEASMADGSSGGGALDWLLVALLGCGVILHWRMLPFKQKQASPISG